MNGATVMIEIRIASVARRRFARAALGALCLAAGLSAVTAPAAAQPTKTPVIFDTDIGDDIDDTWALGMILRCPKLDVKLVVGDQGKAQYRAKLIAKFLETAGRTDVAVGIGLDINRRGGGRQSAWVEGYELEKYPGTVHKDGVQTIIDTIMNSSQPVTLVCVGPLPNIAAALEREPRIAQRARFVGMHGSVRLGYGGSKKPAAEYNVRADVKACQKVFTAGWDMTITPLDTCGLVVLRGEKYAAVRDSKDPVARAIVANYRIWAKNYKGMKASQADERSSTLFDTVGVYLAFAQDFCKMERLPIRVTDKGFTVIEPGAKIMQVASEWKDKGAFEDLLVGAVTGKAPATP